MDSRNDTSGQQHQQHPGHVHEAAHPTDYPPQGQLTRRRPTREQLTHIQGWGADLDLKDRPAVPMERTPPRFIPQVPAPDQQPQRVEVFVSPERPGITPLFGTAQPPSGLSGMIRRAAYKLTENDIRHWLLLLVADRVNVVEGIGHDLANGRVPNVLGEMGIRAELQHNRAGLVKKAVVTTAVVGAAYYLMKGRNRR